VIPGPNPSSTHRWISRAAGLALVLLLLSDQVNASSVYRCGDQTSVTYADRSCGLDAQWVQVPTTSHSAKTNHQVVGARRSARLPVSGARTAQLHKTSSQAPAGPSGILQSPLGLGSPEQQTNTAKKGRASSTSLNRSGRSSVGQGKLAKDPRVTFEVKAPKQKRQGKKASDPPKLKPA
jgi:hypothetical protein